MKVEWLLKVVEDLFVIRKQKKLPKRDIFCFELKTGISNSDAGMLWKKNMLFLCFFNWKERWDALIAQKLP